MKKKSKICIRLASLLFVVLMILCSLNLICLTAFAEANITKADKSYDIAVVFDNSGSMYESAAWCRAKYAMEIFASMLNYDKDKLHIFPMWEVTTNGSQPKSGGSYSAIEIKSEKDINKISNLFTVRPLGTPFAPVKEAHDYLKKSTADEKWLIILTDGAFNEDAREKTATIDLQKRASALASENIKVQYLGFDQATKLKANEAKNFFTQKSTDTSLKDDLIGICNSIFQRSVLPDNRLKGTKLNLDLSMKNVIVFAQGENAKVDSLKDSSGNEVAKTLDSGQRKFSQIKANGYENAEVDKTLAGQVVTFGACPKGEYVLSHSGADKIQIFYEPDVDIDVIFTNSDGQVVDGSSEIVAGEYTVTSRIVDKNTREDVTSHELMGKDVNLRTYFKTSEDEKFTEYENGSKISFEPNDECEMFIEGEYLGKYQITSKGDPNLAWLDGFKISEVSVSFKVDVSVDKVWHLLQEHEEWSPVKVSMKIDGQPLTEEQLASTKLEIATSDSLKYRIERVSGESAYNVYLAQDEDGEYIEPECGLHMIKGTGTYVDEYGKEFSASDDVSVEIQWYSQFWRWLLWILIILAIIIVIIIILHIPVLPSSVYLRIKNSCHTVRVNGNAIGLSTELYPGEIRCFSKACTPLKNKNKTTASFAVLNIKPLGSVNWYELDGTRFKKVNGKYVTSDNETIDQIKPRIIVTDDTELKWNTNQHTITGRIYINHND